MDLTGGGLRRIRASRTSAASRPAHRDRVRRLSRRWPACSRTASGLPGPVIDSVAQLRALHAAGRVPELPSADVVLLVDGYGAMLRDDFEELEDPFVDICSSAAAASASTWSLGMTRWNDVRMAHQPLFGTRVELRLNDPSESSVDRKLSPAAAARRARPGPHRRQAVRTDRPPGARRRRRRRGRRGAGGAGRALRGESWSGPAAARSGCCPPSCRPRRSCPRRSRSPTRSRSGCARTPWRPALLGTSPASDQHLLVFGDAGSGKTTLLRTARPRAGGALHHRRAGDRRHGPPRRPAVDRAGRLPRRARRPTPGQARGLSAGHRRRAARSGPRRWTPGRHRAKAPRIVVLVDDHDILGAGGTEPLEPAAARTCRRPATCDLHVVLTRPVAGAGRALYDAHAPGAARHRRLAAA